MKFYSRRLVMPEHLNGANRLFGGALLSWVDEESYIFARCTLSHPRMVTRFMSEVNFVSAGEQGDVIEFGIETVSMGRTSITLACEVRNIDSGKVIITIDKIVLVAVDEEGEPVAHQGSAKAV
ncbi:MAG: acyl-CoA thioesterase YciA [Saprospiraceae bacterium]|jgi:acyl-CoA thioesterase YciA